MVIRSLHKWFLCVYDKKKPKTFFDEQQIMKKISTTIFVRRPTTSTSFGPTFCTTEFLSRGHYFWDSLSTRKDLLSLSTFLLYCCYTLVISSSPWSKKSMPSRSKSSPIHGHNWKRWTTMKRLPEPWLWNCKHIPAYRRSAVTFWRAWHQWTHAFLSWHLTLTHTCPV